MSGGEPNVTKASLHAAHATLLEYAPSSAETGVNALMAEPCTASYVYQSSEMIRQSSLIALEAPTAFSPTYLPVGGSVELNQSNAGVWYGQQKVFKGGV